MSKNYIPLLVQIHILLEAMQAEHVYHDLIDINSNNIYDGYCM